LFRALTSGLGEARAPTCSSDTRDALAVLAGRWLDGRDDGDAEREALPADLYEDLRRVARREELGSTVRSVAPPGLAPPPGLSPPGLGPVGYPQTSVTNQQS
jgi:hypothetical protein